MTKRLGNEARKQDATDRFYGAYEYLRIHQKGYISARAIAIKSKLNLGTVLNIIKRENINLRDNAPPVVPEI